MKIMLEDWHDGVCMGSYWVGKTGLVKDEENAQDFATEEEAQDQICWYESLGLMLSEIVRS